MRRVEEVAERLAWALDHIIGLMMSGDLETILDHASSKLETEAREMQGPGGARLREAASRLELLAQYVHALRIRYQRYGARNIYSEADYVSGIIEEVLGLIREAVSPETLGADRVKGAAEWRRRR